MLASGALVGKELTVAVEAVLLVVVGREFVASQLFVAVRTGEAVHVPRCVFVE